MHTGSHHPEFASPAVSRRGLLLGWFDLSEPHLISGPFTRWPRATDAALAAVVFATSLIATTASALGDGEELTIEAVGNRPAGAIALLAVAAAALMLRRRQPIAVTVVAMGIMIWWAIAGYGDGQELALLVAIYSVGRYTTNHRSSVAVAVLAIVASMGGTIIDANQRIDVAPAIILSGFSWYLGRLVRNRGDYLALLQERAERLEAEQQTSARQAVADERSRIARELHDVVAHQVSMMTVQAGAAKTIARADLDAAVEAMADVERAGREALGELRHLLGVLRIDTPEGDNLGPQPGLAGIPALAEELTHTGADVSVDIAPLPKGLSTAVELSAYRIVQESFTNVIKHAGRNPSVHLTIGVDDLGLVVEVTNTSTAALGLPSSGFGIAGMRERATLLGGTLTAEIEGPNRFCVVAHLPLSLEKA